MRASRAIALDWSWILVRGILAVGFGIFVLAYSRLTAPRLTATWGAYAIIDGGVACAFAMYARTLRVPAWPSFVRALVEALVGTVALAFYRVLPEQRFATLVGVWALTVGVFGLLTSAYIQRQVSRERFSAFAASVAVAFGLLMLARGHSSAPRLSDLLGPFGLTHGTLLLVSAMRVRRASLG